MTKHASKQMDPAPKPDPIASPERDPLSAFGHEMLAIFRGPLADVRFPDLDRAILEASAADVLRAQIEIESLERSLEEARSRARDASVSFTETASRGLAYARVFAMGQPVLEEALARSPLLASPMAQAHDVRDGKTEDREKKRRGRPRKDQTTAELRMDGAAGSPSAGSGTDASPPGETEVSIAAA